MTPKPKPDEPAFPAPGWYPDPEIEGTIRLWDGNAWTDRAPAPAVVEPVSTWRGIRIVALGVLAAIATAWVIWGLTAPSDVDCSLNDLDRTLAASQGKPVPSKIARCP